MAYFNLSSTEQRTFLSVARYTLLEGPLQLMRFSDSQRASQEADMPGSFWMYGSQVREILSNSTGAEPGGLHFLNEIKNGWAVCDDWSDLSRVWVMNIPPGGVLHAYFGFAKFQPALSAKYQEHTKLRVENVYNGGALQIITRVSPLERAWIRGPMMSIGLTKDSLA